MDVRSLRVSSTHACREGVREDMRFPRVGRWNFVWEPRGWVLCLAAAVSTLELLSSWIWAEVFEALLSP